MSWHGKVRVTRPSLRRNYSFASQEFAHFPLLERNPLHPNVFSGDADSTAPRSTGAVLKVNRIQHGAGRQERHGRRLPLGWKASGGVSEVVILPFPRPRNLASQGEALVQAVACTAGRIRLTNSRSSGWWPASRIAHSVTTAIRLSSGKTMSLCPPNPLAIQI